MDEDERKSGVGRRLVEEAALWARTRGLVELASDAALDNAVSNAFHESTGFVEIERIVCYRRHLTGPTDAEDA